MAAQHLPCGQAVVRRTGSKEEEEGLQMLVLDVSYLTLFMQRLSKQTTKLLIAASYNNNNNNSCIYKAPKSDMSL